MFCIIFAYYYVVSIEVLDHYCDIVKVISQCNTRVRWKQTHYVGV